MTEKKPAPPSTPGCVCVLSGPKGVTFVGSAFNLDRPGGMKLRDAQAHYARQSMLFEFWRKTFWLHDQFSMGEYDIEPMVRRLTERREGDWRVSNHFVGHGDEE